MIPQTFIDDLLHRADIVEVVGQYVRLKKAGGNFQGLCPFHNEKTPSFSVSPTKQFYHCFGCGAHGNVFSFLMEHLGLSFPEAVEAVASQLGLDVPSSAPSDDASAERLERQRQVDLMFQASSFYKEQLKLSPEAIQYMKTRGLTGQMAAKFHLGFAPSGFQSLAAVFPDYSTNEELDAVGLTKVSEKGRRYDRFRERIMFPIRNGKGQVIGFGGRVLNQGEPKYLNSPETPLFNKGNEVYGLYEARQAIQSMRYVLVVEGYMDVLALAQWGFENTVATLGTAVTPLHIRRLTKQTRRLVFAFDGDKAGRKAAWRALEACLPVVNETISAAFVFLPSEHDPDSFIRAQGRDGFEAMVRDAAPLSTFMVQTLQADYALGSAEGNAAAVAFFRPLIGLVQASAFRHGLIQELANLLSMPSAELVELLQLSEYVLDSSEPLREPSHTIVREGARPPARPASRKARRPVGKSPVFNLAVRLLCKPGLVSQCDPLINLFKSELNPSKELLSFLELVEMVGQGPEDLVQARISAKASEAELGPSDWKKQVLAYSSVLDDEVDVESEFNDSLYQCCEYWFKKELDRLSQIQPMTEEARGLYQTYLEQFQAMKRAGVSQV